MNDRHCSMLGKKGQLLERLEEQNSSGAFRSSHCTYSCFLLPLVALGSSGKACFRPRSKCRRPCRRRRKRLRPRLRRPTHRRSPRRRSPRWRSRKRRSRKRRSRRRRSRKRKSRRRRSRRRRSRRRRSRRRRSRKRRSPRQRRLRLRRRHHCQWRFEEAWLLLVVQCAWPL